MKELRGLDLATRSRHELSKAATRLVSITHNSSGLFNPPSTPRGVNENETKGFVRVHRRLNSGRRALASHHKAFLTFQTPPISPK